MSEPFDPNAAPPPQYPPPGAATTPMDVPQQSVPSFGTPPPFGVAGSNEVPAYGAPPPMSGSHGSHTPDPTMPSGVLASFGSRLGAWLLDGLFVSLLTLIALVPFGLIGFNQWETASEPCTVNGQPGTCNVPTDDTIVVLFVLFAVWTLLGILLLVIYHVRPVSKTGQTPGRKILGIKVVDTNTGAPPSFGMALVRYFFASFISGALCYLGYLWMLWDDKKQTWHDKVCSTVVVRA